jgi:nicotinate-nucleotide adenylyltransferase
VHKGHLGLANDARAALHLGAIRWIPSGQPGHREAPRSSPADRVAMLRLALDDTGSRSDSIDETELRATEPTYTVNTLRRLRQELGAAQPLVFLMGADQLLAFDRWKDWKALFDLAHFGVAQRPGYAVTAESLPREVAAEVAARSAGPASIAAQPAGRIVLFQAAPRPVSSTRIRELLAAGGSPTAELPSCVLHYIQSRGLYGAAATPRKRGLQ